MTLELFKKDSCPFCRRVMNYLQSVERNDVVYRDIVQDKANEERLIAVGGKKQVPCLFIDGAPLYESLDIIEWLEQHPKEG